MAANTGTSISDLMASVAQPQTDPLQVLTNIQQQQPTQVAVGDPDAMKASFERILDVMRKAGPGSPEWNARAPYVNDMSQKIYNLTGEVYSQGQWVKVAK